MPLTYQESQALCQSSWFQAKIKTAVASYTNYIQNTPPSDPNFDNIKATATMIGRQSQAVTETIAFALSGDTELMQAGSGIPDPTLQLLVEKQLKIYYPIPGTPSTQQAAQGSLTKPPKRSELSGLI